MGRMVKNGPTSSPPAPGPSSPPLPIRGSSNMRALFLKISKRANEQNQKKTLPSVEWTLTYRVVIPIVST